MNQEPPKYPPEIEVVLRGYVMPANREQQLEQRAISAESVANALRLKLQAEEEHVRCLIEMNRDCIEDRERAQDRVRELEKWKEYAVSRIEADEKEIPKLIVERDRLEARVRDSVVALLQTALREADGETPQDLLTALHNVGLHLVTGADMRVLEAMASTSVESLRWLILQCPTTPLGVVAKAELARRGKKP